ncbi:MAG: MmgE/PrpD family protein [Acidisphaera sp.]|nr:MmgE/PrpD family protein [Acidisphaera sp.]
MPSDHRPAAGEAPALGDPAVTGVLAQYLANARAPDLPTRVRKEAARTFCNWLGCAVGGSRHEAVSIAIGALEPFSGPKQATVLGRAERLDILNAALVNGISSHVFDFDDTHLKTVIHPAGPVASAALAFAEYRPVSGRDFLHALVLGVETECRIGNAVFPAHYDVGWHITGTAGVFGAAAAIGKLLGLDAQRMAWALGLAATQPVGLREMFGTMTKSFHPGRAAQNGMTAALLAAGGYTSSDRAIEAKRGWATVLSTARNYAEITEGLGERFEIGLNTYKPFACGIVIHPAIDGCVQLRREHALTPEAVERIALRVNPLVLELTGKRTPQTGLEGKFSVFHACAVAIAEGAAGESQFSDAAVANPVIVALRDRVQATAAPEIPPEAVEIEMTLRDGGHVAKSVRHAIGSLERPMTDADLEAKFAGLTDSILSPSGARRLLDLCWRIEELGDVADIARAAAIA